MKEEEIQVGKDIRSFIPKAVQVAMATAFIAGAIPAWACKPSEGIPPEPTPSSSPLPPSTSFSETPTLTPVFTPEPTPIQQPTPKPTLQPTLQPEPTLTPEATQIPRPTPTPESKKAPTATPTTIPESTPTRMPETTSPPRPAKSPSPTETATTSTEDEILSLKAAIEERFNISLTTVNDVYGPKSLWSAKPEDMVVWTLNRLKVLEQSLSLLPKHFYQPSEKGDKFTLSLDIGQRADCICGFSREVLPHRINIGTDHFESVENLLPEIAHEFVHLVTPMEGKDPRSDPSKYASPWYQKIDNILGKKFVNVRPELAGMAKSKVDPERMAIAMYGGGERLNFYEKFLYGVEGFTMAAYEYRLPHEFIAVLGEIYVEGKEYFYRMYGKFFPQDTVEKLYNFVKEYIFRSTEYLGSLKER